MHRGRLMLWMWDSLGSSCTSSPQPCCLTSWARCALMSPWLWIVLDRRGQRMAGVAGQCHYAGSSSQWTGTSCLEKKRIVSLLNGSRERQQKSRPLIFSDLLWDFSECIIVVMHSSAWDLSGHHIAHTGSAPGMVTLGIISAIVWLWVKKWISIVELLTTTCCSTPHPFLLQEVMPKMSEALAHIKTGVIYEKLCQNRFILNISYMGQDSWKALITFLLI